MKESAMRCEAYLFDLDGVLTPTADIHRKAWNHVFMTFFHDHPDADPYTEDDYFTLIDGRPRFAGVQAVLNSRGISVPRGNPDDPPSMQSVCAIGNLKDTLFLNELNEHPIKPYPGSLRLIRALNEDAIPMAVVSASKNASLVLTSAGIIDLFAVIVDGRVAEDLGLAGKPAPATFLEAAHRLQVDPTHTAVIEDALGGVEAGRRGGFSPVIGVNRGAGHEVLLSRGADIVVDDLAELMDSKEES